MKSFVYALLFAILFTSLVCADTSPAEKWITRYKSIGNSWDDTHAFVMDGAGNMYVTGFRSDNGTGMDYATVKLDPNGKQVWLARYDGADNKNDRSNAIAVDGAGNVYVTGYSFSNDSNTDYITIKYDSDGKQVWMGRYNGPGNSEDFAAGMALDGAGNIYVTGWSIGEGTGYDYATIKYDSLGNQKWVMRYNSGDDKFDTARVIAIDGTGNVYVSGLSYMANTPDVVTVKYDSQGNQKWVIRYDGSAKHEDIVRAIMVDDADNIYVAVVSVGHMTSYDYVVIKYDCSGKEKWVGRWNGARNREDMVYDMAVDGEQNVYLTGLTLTKEAGFDYATVKFDCEGKQKWAACYDGPGNRMDGAYGMVLDDEGNVYVTGRSFGDEAGYDFATIKYDANGQQEWVSRYSGPGTSRDGATDIALNKSGQLFVFGDSKSTGELYDFVTIEYSGMKP